MHSFAYTIFCDDVRDEIGGKVSYIGEYSGSMLVPAPFPVSLPKFAIITSYVCDRDKEPSEITVRIFLPGDPDDKPSTEGVVAVTKEHHVDVLSGAQLDSDISPIFMTKTRTILAPLVIRESGSIKVRLEINGEIYKAGALFIQSTAPA